MRNSLQQVDYHRWIFATHGAEIPNARELEASCSRFSIEKVSLLVAVYYFLLYCAKQALIL